MTRDEWEGMQQLVVSVKRRVEGAGLLVLGLNIDQNGPASVWSCSCVDWAGKAVRQSSTSCDYTVLY